MWCNDYCYIYNQRDYTMVKKLIIIGASALGREVYNYAQDALPNMNIAGFLDSRLNILDKYVGYPPVIESPDTYMPNPDDVFVCALGEPDMREKYVKLIESRGGKFISVIHPSAFIGKNVQIGDGTIVSPGANIGCDTKLGNHVYIGLGANVCHDCIVNDFVSVSPDSTVAGWCSIGSNCFLGISCTVIPHVDLGGTTSKDAVYVAAGAVVTKSYSGTRIMGVPAKPR